MTVPADNVPTCPLCGRQLYLVRAFALPVTSGSAADMAISPFHDDDWEIVCENDHRLDSGGRETDGRNARIGWRAAQILGGVR